MRSDSRANAVPFVGTGRPVDRIHARGIRLRWSAKYLGDRRDRAGNPRRRMEQPDTPPNRSCPKTL